jgi:hypothetical protein
MGMLKKAASGVLALLPNLRAHRLAALCGVCAPRVKMAAALPVEGRVLARLGWAGQTADFFEHPLPLTMRGSSETSICYWSEISNRP